MRVDVRWRQRSKDIRLEPGRRINNRNRLERGTQLPQLLAHSSGVRIPEDTTRELPALGGAQFPVDFGVYQREIHVVRHP